MLKVKPFFDLATTLFRCVSVGLALNNDVYAEKWKWPIMEIENPFYYLCSMDFATDGPRTGSDLSRIKLINHDPDGPTGWISEPSLIGANLLTKQDLRHGPRPVPNPVGLTKLLLGTILPW